MASFKYDAQKKTARIQFRFGGTQFSKTEKVETERHAERMASAIEETILDIERGRLKIPDGSDVKTFILTSGRLDNPKNKSSSRGPDVLTLAKVFEIYFATLTTDSKAKTTIQTAKTHSRNLLKVFGGKIKVPDLTLDVIQKYVDARIKDQVVRDTIHHELVTLQVVWKWAHKRKHVLVPLPWKIGDATLPKGHVLPSFQTWDQIARRVDREQLTPKQIKAAWESLWLNQEETIECLEWVKENAPRAFMHPMFAFAAYTGARRSEMLRSRRDDWDFKGGVVHIRQMKADRSKVFTYREVAIHPDLADIMKEWFAYIPDLTYAISKDDRMLEVTESSKLFRKTVDGGKWEVLRGWHVFRHSLASNMAASGIDQRLIDATLGHATEAMARRYRHLSPSQQADAIGGLFTRRPTDREARSSDTP